MTKNFNTNTSIDEYGFISSTDYPCSILIAEDNQVNQLILKKILHKAGYTPDLAKDGTEAVQMSMDKKYDLIFMDCMMPEMDGFEATKIINERPESPVIVAVTAGIRQQEKQKCYAVGMQDFIMKPFVARQIFESILKFIPPN